MKNKILCGMVVVLSIILIAVSLKKETNFSFDEKKQEEPNVTQEPVHSIKVLDQTTGEITEMDLETYIIGVVAAEMPASFEIEALKAQAVASRTFAIYKKEHRSDDFDIIKGTSDQAFNTTEEMKAKWQDNYETYVSKISQAVKETKNEILTYQGQTIESFYFAMSNGYTEKSELVFQEELPYIDSVESSWDNESLNNYEVTKTFSKEEFCTLLNITCEDIVISEINRTNSGRVSSLKVNDTVFKGVEFRKMLSLRSTDFEISVGEDVVITTKGSGHGVGMSQYGANGMAKEGKTYQEILNYFYQNIEISKI